MPPVDFPLEEPAVVDPAPPKWRFVRMLFKRDAFSWSLYDFANTIYSMNIVSSYFKPWLVEDLGKSGAYFDVTVSLSMLAVAVISPVLGVISDYNGKKKLFLFLFTLSCCLCVAGFGFLSPQALIVILIMFGLSNFFYEGGMVFYNSLLYSVSKDDIEARYISGYGVALGYLGAIIGLLIVLPFVTGDLFGFVIPFIEGGGKSAAFVPTALLFFFFALPLFLFVRERHERHEGESITIGGAYKNLWQTLRSGEKYPGLLKFLAADFLIKNAVTAVIINIGVFCLFVIGFTEAEKTAFLMIVTVAAVIGSLIIGRLAAFMPLARLIRINSVGWIVCLALFGIASAQWQYWILSAGAGVFLGGVWTLHRPYLAEMTGKVDVGRFFGFYSLTGKAAATIGPLWWALFFFLFSPNTFLGDLTSETLSFDGSLSEQLPYRVAAASLALLVAIGLAMFNSAERERRVALNI